MKLSDVTVDMLRRATRIYLEVAYPKGQVPPHVMAMVDFPPGAGVNDILNDGRFEHTFDDDGIITKYQLRLGNHLYPHMKMGLERCTGGDEYVFVADTHDCHIPVECFEFEDEDLIRLFGINSDIQQEIERLWGEEGLPTQAMMLGSSGQGPQRNAPERKDKTILIVDDDESMADLEYSIVDQAGYDTIVCQSGQHAIQVIRSEARIDLCLLDMMMPQVSGVPVRKEIFLVRNDAFPVVIVSAMPKESITAVKDDIIVAKPFEPDYLVSVIRSCIG